MKALKKVPPGAKGLSKLPTSVRNKMGYMQKGGKITKKMVDDQFNRNLDSHANTTNRLAKQAATGLKPNGFPMKPKNRKALQKDVDQRKAYEQKAKPNYRYVGTKLPGGPAPFEDDAMPKAKKGMKAVKKYKGGGKTPVRKNVTKNLKKRDESEIDRRYESTVGRNPRTGDLNYPIGLDMDKLDATAGMAGNDDKLRKAISDKYYAEKRKEMGIDKIKTYSRGGKVLKYKTGGKIGPDQKKNKGRINVQELPRNEQKKLGMKFRDESQLGRGKHEDFHSMNLYSATPAEALKYYKMDAAKKALKGKGITVGADMSPEKIMQIANKKVDMNSVNASAKTSFMDWSADRRKNPKAYAGSYKGVGGAQRLKK